MMDQGTPSTAPATVPASTTDSPPAATVAPTTTAPSFSSATRRATEADLGASWRGGCPVSVEDLRWLDLTHWTDDGHSEIGSLVVHADHVDDVVAVFRLIFDAGFPIHSMQPITEFGGDDNASMRANNTSAFNCREIDGQLGVWSQHAYGGAIDINPLVNPWVRGSSVDPPEGAPYVARDASIPGLIIEGDAVTDAFASIGWGWGGNWTSTLDYQHFSHNNR